MKFHRDKYASRAVLNENDDCVASCGCYSDNTRCSEEVYQEQCFHTRLFVKAPEMLGILRRMKSVGLSNDEIDSIISYVETEDVE